MWEKLAPHSDRERACGCNPVLVQSIGVHLRLNVLQAGRHLGDWDAPMPSPDPLNGRIIGFCYRVATTDSDTGSWKPGSKCGGCP